MAELSDQFGPYIAEGGGGGGGGGRGEGGRRGELIKISVQYRTYRG